jgi:hypothetical protein
MGTCRVWGRAVYLQRRPAPVFIEEVVAVLVSVLGPPPVQVLPCRPRHPLLTRRRRTRAATPPRCYTQSIRCSLSVTVYPLQSIRCSLSVAVYPLQSIRCSLSVAVYPLQSIRCSLSVAVYPLQSIRYSLSVTVYPLQSIRCSLSVAVYPLQSIRYSLSVTVYPLQSIRYSLSVAVYPLQSIRLFVTIYPVHALQRTRTRAQTHPHRITRTHARTHARTCLCGRRPARRGQVLYQASPPRRIGAAGCGRGGDAWNGRVPAVRAARAARDAGRARLASSLHRALCTVRPASQHVRVCMCSTCAVRGARAQHVRRTDAAPPWPTGLYL